jgi:hypothetical protein
MSAEYDVEFPFLFNATIHRPEAEQVSRVYCKFQETKRRNETQLHMIEKIAPLLSVEGQALRGVDPLRDQCVCYAIDEEAQKIKSFNGEDAFRKVIFLFNVIIALEWNPDVSSLQQIRLAAMKTSDFLYDVTNGYMAIGQVIIGGRDLMDMADIQIMASNRIHPRSWIAALNVKEKFKPIRIGRGIWQKNHGTLLTWDSPEGYRGLVHEWGHYAFGLADDYLRLVALKRTGKADRLWEEADRAPAKLWTADELDLAAPDVALPIESVMANTQISEYGPGLKETFAAIRRNYWAAEDDSPREGPDELSLPLPRFLELKVRPSLFSGVTLGEAAVIPNQPEVIRLEVQEPIGKARQKADPQTPTPQKGESHWLYLLKGPFKDGAPQRMIAQGKLGERDELANEFRLLGVAEDDQVVLVSQVALTMMVQRATMVRNTLPGTWRHQPGRELRPDGWVDVTPAALDNGGPFFVDVIPEAQPTAAVAGQPLQADLRVRVEAAERPTEAYIYPSGAQAGAALPWVNKTRMLTGPVTVPHLDGHVLLRWVKPAKAGAQAPTEKLFICSYSQGGGPNTSSGGILPVTGGSSDGNAMIFFNQHTEKPSADQNLGQTTMRLVTTTLTVPPRNLGGLEPRSYIFSLACNEPFDKGNQPSKGDPPSHRAALVLYYDREALKHGNDLLIYRWDGAGWQRLTTFLRSDLPYVAVPIGNLSQGGALETAPNLTNDRVPLRVERYCILLTEAAAAGAGAPGKPDQGP